MEGKPASRPAFWPAHVVVNIAVGTLAGAAWPFVHLMGFVIAVEAGWAVDDPTVTEDGWGIPVGLGIAVIVVVGAVFAAANTLLARWGRVPARWWTLPAAAVSLLVTVAVANLPRW
jgi:hypothetical protein